MAPGEYKLARSKTEEKDNASFRVTINGQPYLPFLNVDSDNEDSVRHAVKEIFGLTTKVDSLKVRSVTGGITNRLFRVSGIVSDDEGIPDSVLVRVFGGHGMIERDSETSTYAALSEQGVAPAYHGRFGNGRFEGWCDGYSALNVDDLSDQEISKSIAKALSKMHNEFVIPDSLKEYHNPDQPPTLWTQLTEWLDQALSSKFKTPNDTDRAAALELVKLKDELKWLQSDVVSPNCKVGFCHNDLLAANILSNKESTIQLIDFEYGGINYHMYDIANHFNEFAGGTDGDATPDYTKFPSPQLQRDFVTEYLAAAAAATSTSATATPDGDQVTALLKEIKGFVLANHLVWGLWGINQAATEGCDEFDYLQYGTCRIQQYYNVKSEWN